MTVPPAPPRSSWSTAGGSSVGSCVTDDMPHDPSMSGTIVLSLNRSSQSIGGPLRPCEMEIPMHLTLTHYFDADPSDVAQRLEGAVVVGLDRAASRIAVRREATVIEPCTDGVRVLGGLDLLDGSELRVGGETRLTTLEFTLPWRKATITTPGFSPPTPSPMRSPPRYARPPERTDCRGGFRVTLCRRSLIDWGCRGRPSPMPTTDPTNSAKNSGTGCSRRLQSSGIAGRVLRGECCEPGRWARSACCSPRIFVSCSPIRTPRASSVVWRSPARWPERD